MSIKAVLDSLADLNLNPALSAHLICASRLAEKRPRCATGIAALDDLLGGGWPCGALSELCGRRSSGRTTVLYAALASAITAGHTVALIDSGGALDPRRAAGAGIDLDRLLWIRCGATAWTELGLSPSGVHRGRVWEPSQGSHQIALKAADLVVAAGGFGLVALDLGEGRVNGARTGAAWNRLKHAAERQQTALLVATPWRTVGAFAAAAITLRARRVRFHRGHHGAAANGNSHCPPLLADLETTAARERGGAKQGAAESAEGDGACASLVFSSLS